MIDVGTDILNNAIIKVEADEFISNNSIYEKLKNASKTIKDDFKGHHCHNMNEVQINWKMSSANVPNEVFEKYGHNTIGEHYEMIIEDNARDFIEIELPNYEWIDESHMEGRSGGYLIMRAIYSLIQDTNDSLESIQYYLDELKEIDKRNCEDFKELYENLKYEFEYYNDQFEQFIQMTEDLKAIEQLIKTNQQHMIENFESIEFWNEFMQK